MIVSAWCSVCCSFFAYDYSATDKAECPHVRSDKLTVDLAAALSYVSTLEAVADAALAAYKSPGYLEHKALYEALQAAGYK